MEPISAIVGALVAGAAAGATAVASDAVKDAYSALKRLIVDRFNRKAAVEMIEEAPQSEVARTALKDTLKEVKADSDQEVLKLADKLLEALDALGPDKLQRANVKIGDVMGYRDAIVRDISATGDVTTGNVIAKTGDAMVTGVTAGNGKRKS